MLDVKIHVLRFTSRSVFYDMLDVMILVLRHVGCPDPCFTTCLMSRTLFYDMLDVKIHVLRHVWCHDPCFTTCSMSRSLFYDMFDFKFQISRHVWCQDPCFATYLMSRSMFYDMLDVKILVLRHAWWSMSTWSFRSGWRLSIPSCWDFVASGKLGFWLMLQVTEWLSGWLSKWLSVVGFLIHFCCSKSCSSTILLPSALLNRVVSFQVDTSHPIDFPLYFEGIALAIQFVGFFVIFVHCIMDPLPWDDLPIEWNPSGIPVFLSTIAYCYEGTNLILHFHNRMTNR